MRLANFVFCDLIRTETSGKRMLIGVFESLVVPQNTQWPSLRNISFYIRVVRNKEDVIPTSFELRIIRGGEVKSKINGELKGAHSGIENMIFDIGIPLNLSGPGRLLFQIALFVGGDEVAAFNSESLDVTVQD